MTTALKETDYFFCEACLEDKPLDDISWDPRYCQWCFDFLTEEATLVTSFITPKWVPRINKGGSSPLKPLPEDLSANSRGIKAQSRGKLPAYHKKTIMSPLEGAVPVAKIRQLSFDALTEEPRLSKRVAGDKEMSNSERHRNKRMQRTKIKAKKAKGRKGKK